MPQVARLDLCDRSRHKQPAMSDAPVIFDRALLRRFEPVLRFTKGERFLPMDVEPYVRESSLWVQRPGD